MSEAITTTIDAEERDLIVRCQQGDRLAFEPIVTRYMRRAAAFALGWTGNLDDALDLSQEAFVRAFKAIRRYDPERPFYPWLHRILRNLCINHLGRASRLHEVPLDDLGAPRPRDPGLRAYPARAPLWRLGGSCHQRLRQNSPANPWI